MSSEKTGGRLLAEALVRQGVGQVFTLPGGHLDPFYDASIDVGLPMVSTRHEQAAVHMAEGWAWATGSPGVAAVTAGPGVTDAVTGVVNAWSSCVPLLLIGGRVSIPEFDTGALQDVDQLPLVERHTRLARSVSEGRRIGEYVTRALAAATAARPGPAYLEIPADQLALAHANAELPPKLQRRRSAADPADVDRAADALRSAKRPVCIAGSGVHWSGAERQLVEFAERTGIPVLTHKGARGAIADDHPLGLGAAFPLAPAAIGACSQADVILVVGARLDFTIGYGRAPLFAAGATIIRVDLDATEPLRGRPGDVVLLGDAARVLEQLTAAVGGGVASTADWVAGVQQARADVEAGQRQLAGESAQTHPLAVAHAVSDVVGRSGTIVIDGGETLVWSWMGTRAYRPARTLAVGPLGTLGVGVPFAIAAKLARPDEPCVLITGDGAFGLNAMEIETAVRHRVPIVVVVVNDSSWGMCRHGQGVTKGYDRLVATELGDTTRYDVLAQALGGEGRLVKDATELPGAIEAALSVGVPYCLDVPVDRSVVSPATRFLGVK